MHIDIRNGGGKKFSHLFLVQPDFAIFRVQGHRSLAIYGVVYNDMLCSFEMMSFIVIFI